jgi:hypothetical protein
LWRFVRAPARSTADAIVAGSLAFAAAGAALTAIGRAQFDPSVAAESRYTELATLGWLGLLLSLPIGVTGRPWGRTGSVLLAAVALIALPIQLFVGRVWAAKADHLQAAALTLATGVEDRDWIGRIHPLGLSYIASVLPHLRSRGVDFLAFPEAGRQVTTADHAPQCEGQVYATEAPGVSPGLRIQAELRGRATTLRVLDSESRVRGLAVPAPTVLDPLAHANDFVWAELDVLAGSDERGSRWLGVSNRGSGPPFTAQLVDEAGQSVCWAPVVCCHPAPGPTPRSEIVIRGNVAEGVVDRADCTAVAGWVWDPVRPISPLDVRVTVEGGGDIVERASAFRQDLLDAGKGNGAHAFVVPAEALELGRGVWQVSVTVAATGVPLAGSPKTVTCER